MEIHKVLFVNLDRIGDVVRSTFIFRALRKHYPDAYIACLTAGPVAYFLRKDPYVDEVFTLPHQEIRNLRESGKTVLHMCLPVMHLLETLKMHEFDLLINPFSDVGAMVARYVKPRYMLGRAMDTSAKYNTYGDETVKFVALMANLQGMRANITASFAEVYAQILRDLSIELSLSELYPKLYVGEDDRRFAHTFLREEGFSADRLLVGFQVGAYVKGKMWPINEFRKLAEWLYHEHNATIVLTGSEHEAQTLCREMIEGMSFMPIVAAGKTSLPQSAALIEACDFFVTNDTGPMHIAAAMGVPIVALFGFRKSIPVESRPWGEIHRVLVREYVADIPLAEVQDACRAMLTQIRAAREAAPR